VFAVELQPKNAASSHKQQAQCAPSRVIGFYRKFHHYQKRITRSFTVEYIAPQSLKPTRADVGSWKSIAASDMEGSLECSICMESLRGDGTGVLCQLVLCKHVLHKACADRIVEKSNKCPMCRSHFNEPRGTSPSGKLTVDFDPSITCTGSSPGTIVLHYDLQTGFQKSYHDDRGEIYSRESRCAYIPDTKDGRLLIRRLVYAFLRGRTFPLVRPCRLESAIASHGPRSITGLHWTLDRMAFLIQHSFRIATWS